MNQIRRPQEGAHPAQSATGETKSPGTAASAAKRPEAKCRVGADVSNKRPAPSAFQSILFQNPEKYPAAETAGEPDCFGDLNLDQTMASLTSGRDGYELLGYFHTSLTDVDDIAYRHEIMQDLEDCALASRIRFILSGVVLNATFYGLSRALTVWLPAACLHARCGADLRSVSFFAAGALRTLPRREDESYPVRPAQFLSGLDRRPAGGDPGARTVLEDDEG